MKELFTWIGKNSKQHTAELAAETHFKLVSIHPFVDGNGRTARLLMNLILLQGGYPPALIRKEDRLTYLNCLERGQLGGELAAYFSFIYGAIDRSLEIYLKALSNEDDETVIKINRSKLYKIGELARKAGESVPTIRHWTKEGLLSVTDTTGGGYQLFSEEMVRRARMIRQLQKEKRLSLSEIKAHFTAKNTT